MSSNRREKRGQKRRRQGKCIDMPSGKKHRPLCDETQTAQERRDIRVQYRQLLDNTKTQRAVIVDTATEAFKETLDEQNHLFEQVSYPSEAFLDAQQTTQMADLLVEQTQDLANAQFTFGANDIIQALITKFPADNGRIDWYKVGEMAAKYFKTIPSTRMMNGKMQKEIVEKPVKQRREYKRKRPETEQPVTQPSVVKAKDIRNHDKTETKTRIRSLRKLMRERDRDPETRQSNMFELLVNPESYSETVENFFDMSFLCRQGWSQLEVDEDTNQPILTYVSHEDNRMRKKQEPDHSNSQCIIRLDPSMFVDIVDTYDLTQSQVGRDVSMGPESDEDDADLDKMLGEGAMAAPPPRQPRSQRSKATPGSQRKTKVKNSKREMSSESDDDEE